MPAASHVDGEIGKRQEDHHRHKRVDQIGNVREVGKPLYAINGETADIARYGNSPTRSGLTSAMRRSRQRPRSFDVPVTRTPSPLSCDIAVSHEIALLLAASGVRGANFSKDSHEERKLVAMPASSRRRIGRLRRYKGYSRTLATRRSMHHEGNRRRNILLTHRKTQIGPPASMEATADD